MNASGQSLEDFVESFNGGSQLRVEHDFGGGYVRLRTSEAERRQAAQDIRCVENIVLELLRNAHDAHASHVFLAMSREGDKRILVCIDDGEGIPASMHDHVFEPRVTSKLDTNHVDPWGMHGRGMALFSIRANARTARVAASDVGRGCSMYILADTGRLPERSDQSSFPTFELVQNGTVNVRGPRNILRTACEFAIEYRDSCSVYVGSVVDVASTLYRHGVDTLSSVDRAFCRNVDDLPLSKRLATCADPESFARIARSLGLDLSARSARRILDGEIPALDALVDQITITSSQNAHAASNRVTRRGSRTAAFKLDAEDADALASALAEAYRPIAAKHYLHADVTPSVRVSHGSITVSIPAVEEQ